MLMLSHVEAREVVEKVGEELVPVVRGVPVRVRAVVAALVILTPAMALVLARLLPVVGLAVVSN